jgi:transposase InsO family protein
MLEQLIRSIFRGSKKIYGTRRIKEALERRYGWIVSKRRIGTIMKSLGLEVKTKRRFTVVTTDSNHRFTIAPNRLQQDFNVTVPNHTYVGDITYIRTREGWLYLSTVIDLFSRAVVG